MVIRYFGITMTSFFQLMAVDLEPKGRETATLMHLGILGRFTNIAYVLQIHESWLTIYLGKPGVHGKQTSSMVNTVQKSRLPFSQIRFY